MKSSDHQVIVIGGGAAGFFAAITCAEALGGKCGVTVLERGPQFLQKVKISGGGRCNVTHACFDPKAFTVKTAPERFAKQGDPMLGLLEAEVDVAKAVKRLEGLLKQRPRS